MGFLKKMWNDRMLMVTLMFTLLSFLKGLPHVEDIDWKTIFILASLMICIQILNEVKFLTYCSNILVRKAKNEQGLMQTVVFLGFFGAMLLTNDVAIITLLPIYFKIAKAQNLPVILPSILITVAANLGSISTPFGNPQNIFLVSYYNLSLSYFFEISILLTITNLLVLYLITHVKFKKKELTVSKEVFEEKIAKFKLIIGLVLFFSVLCSVFGLIPSYISLVLTIIGCLFLQKNILKKIDYNLLLIFICFFIIVGTLSRGHLISIFFESMLTSKLMVYLSAIVTSQIISNVPASILLAKFTGLASAVFIGVNIGGLGTMIASLANLLAFKQFVLYYPEKRTYFFNTFTKVNVILLLVLGTVGYLFVLVT
ncbi:SLC13 family permease [Liquorilactobacillus cacaonum]|uniref:Di-and tricarboxylate transporter n=1 Tax=Liquorilactobacillus cacaonum DSM 21116 TaxID=1423729 RepID=A0A0R2CLV3_9LACO|nr:SLC13 family permease [Liquorilactobacillus cacaonum]KRM92605.1 di- and tricarboxylate transporter [Liquorilactobacillus cacaonum DSM 21116]